MGRDRRRPAVKVAGVSCSFGRKSEPSRLIPCSLALLIREKHSTRGPTWLVGENLTSPSPEQRRIDTMAEFQINNEDLTGLKGKVVIITGMPGYLTTVHRWQCCTEDIHSASG